MGEESPVGAFEQNVMTVPLMYGSMERCRASGVSIRWYHRASDTVESDVPSATIKIRFFTGLGVTACPNVICGVDRSVRVPISAASSVRRGAYFIVLAFI